MNKKRDGKGGRRSGGHARRSGSRPGGKPSSRAGRPRPTRQESGDFKIVERRSEGETAFEAGSFRVLIAVHRPRFRGRAERAAALEGWEVTALLNKQDPVGLVAKPPRPPDLLILSGDFGRQRDYAIFRAVQPWRERGMKLIGLVGNCEIAPEDYPDSVPERLCDVCLVPPYKTAELRAVFTRLYEQMRGQPAPPPLKSASAVEDLEEAD
ncbi:MAG TPA: hypothetical protein VFA07_08235 [Chthonomonadaceae bacterium]|nr:hypothetical protein [Chthonomonadaceae bacterium]